MNHPGLSGNGTKINSIPIKVCTFGGKENYGSCRNHLLDNSFLLLATPQNQSKDKVQYLHDRATRRGDPPRLLHEEITLGWIQYLL